MTETRRPISLFASIAVGIGAALLVLLAGGRPAAAAPASISDSKPAPVAQCFARDDSAITLYQSADSNAVRQAVAAAVPNDLVRLAGTCAGVAAQGGTTQTVVITKALTLIGGFTFADWSNSFPITQPTTLDAQGLGRVITTSADITIGAMTVQHGQSFGGNGGGVYAGANLTALGAVNFLSNTTLVTTTKGAPCCFGGGYFAQGQAHLGQPATQLDVQASNVLTEPVVFQNNSAYNGGAGYSFGNVNGSDIDVINNLSLEYGNLVAIGTMTLDHINIDSNNGYIGAGVTGLSGVTLNHLTCTNNTASFGTCVVPLGSEPMSVQNCTANNNTAGAGTFMYAVSANVTIDSCRITDDTGKTQGPTLSLWDTNATMKNLLIKNRNGIIAQITGNGSNSQVHAQQVTLGASLFFDSYKLSRPANPLASSVVPTLPAFLVSGATLFITDTIMAGFAKPLQTDGAPTSTIIGDYNLFDQTPVISGTNITTGTHSLVGNPLFSDNLGHLSAGSPAIDHGINVGLNVDLDGNPRPIGAGFDIGAYEFQVVLLKLFLPLVRR